MNMQTALLCHVTVATCLLAASAQAATTYELNPASSTLSFGFEQAGAESSGRFGVFNVSFTFAENELPASNLDVVVNVGSLETEDEERNEILRGADLFDVRRFPTARFTATKIMRIAPGRYEAAGKLTIRGVTRVHRVPFAFTMSSESGVPVWVMTGETRVKRLDYGVGQGDWKSTEWVGNDVKIAFKLRLRPSGAASSSRPATESTAAAPRK